MSVWTDQMKSAAMQDAASVVELEAALRALVTACNGYDEQPDSTLAAARYKGAFDKARDLLNSSKFKKG